jgi:hypothetical protein
MQSNRMYMAIKLTTLMLLAHQINITNVITNVTELIHMITNVTQYQIK